MNVYRTLADGVVVAHFAYVAFVLFGLVAILIGIALRRPWARNFWFRIIHLAMIVTALVVTWPPSLGPSKSAIAGAVRSSVNVRVALATLPTSSVAVTP